ncbi:MAG: CrcB family protein [Aurantimicrobium sp.]|nr:CrcB family protein [Aurantimicrobium sp.]
MSAVQALILVLLSGAAGALLRFGLSRALPVAARPLNVPRAVLIVNVVGSFLAGVALALTQTETIPAVAGVMIITGLCGGLTTFSTFAVESVELVMQGKVRVAARSLALNFVLGVGAAALGYLPTLVFAF